MESQVIAGLMYVLLAGILQGIFALPMKFARGWNHENIWLVFAFSGLVVFPWALTFATAPHLGAVYALTAPKTLGLICGFGALWGIGATLTGIGLNLLGIGLGLSIILGLSASIGSLVPLLALTPQKLATREGALYLVGSAIMLAGIAVCAWAGVARDALRASARPSGEAAKTSFWAGLAVCIGSGVLSGALNFSYAFGTEASAHAVQLGASPVWAPNVIAAPAVSGGFIANFVYCAYMLKKNSTTARFWQAGSSVNWLRGALMGACWFGGLAFYGLGISRMGSLGVVLGWPLMTGAIVIASNVAGYFTGEWSGVGRRTGVLLGAGMAIVLAALWVLSVAQRA